MVFVIALSVTLTLIYFQGTENPVASPNKIELTLDKGEPLRVSFVGDSMMYGLFATEQRLGFHQLVVAEWRNSGPVADNDENMIGGTAGELSPPRSFLRINNCTS